jgi:hypothetical protein
MVVLSCGLWMTIGTVTAQKSSPAPKDILALGEDEVVKLVLLMNTGPNGKVSRHEFMRFMEAEFDRLDTKRRGELDPKELMPRSSVSRPAAGK